MSAKEAAVLGRSWQVWNSPSNVVRPQFQCGILLFFSNRAKYDAYKGLGKMTRERAMELYVDELKKIIETMSYTDNVAEFMDSVGELDSVDLDDLEAVAPEVIKKVRSQPNSPFGKHSCKIILTIERKQLLFVGA